MSQCAARWQPWFAGSLDRSGRVIRVEGGVMHVLVGTDGSDEAMAGAVSGLGLLGTLDKVTLVCVVDNSSILMSGHESGFAGGMATDEEVAELGWWIEWYKRNRDTICTGRLIRADLADPEVEDMLDDLGELVLKFGGQVVIVPADRMPTQSGIAAIDRF